MIGLEMGPCEGQHRANERMQLTWLLRGPQFKSASVHECASGPRGLGSPATQLMRAVRQHLQFGE